MKKKFRKKNIQKKINNEEDKINNILDVSIHSLSRNNSNENQNYNDYQIKDNKNHIITTNYKNNRNNIIQIKSSKLTNILGKINHELYKHPKNYKSKISEFIQKDYLNLKSFNNSYKTNDGNSFNLSKNVSKNNLNQKSLINEKKIIYNNFGQNGLSRNTPKFLYNNKIKVISNIPPNENCLIPISYIYQTNNQNYRKNKISNIILRNTYIKDCASRDFQNDSESDNDADNKIIQLSKIHKSIKKNKNKSQNKFKSKLNNEPKNERNNGPLSNPKNINNMGNFYNYWTDNDRHLGGKINLSLNNQFMNNIDSYSYLYYIIKIQSLWKGYKLRKSLLLRKSFQNQKLNIFSKQKLCIKKLFYILNYKFKKHYFLLFKNNINNNKKIGYEIKTPLLNNISNNQNSSKDKNGKNKLLYNKKNLNEPNLKIYSYINSELGSPKIKRNETKLNNNISSINKTKNNKYEYQVLKTHSLCYKSHEKNKVRKEKEDINKNIKEQEKYKNNFIEMNEENKNEKIETCSKKIVIIVPNEKNTNNISINNINLRNKDNGINKNNNYHRNLINNRNNKLNKYKEYIYFLFLLFARIQKANHRLIFRELVRKLKVMEFDKLKRIRNKALLKIIKKNENKRIKYYLKIFKEKILIERIKEKILYDNSNNSNLLRIVKNNNLKNISNSVKKEKNINNTFISRQGSKRHIKIKKLNRSISVNQSLNKNISYYSNNYIHFPTSALSKSLSSLISPRKVIIKHLSNAIKPTHLGEYYEYTPSYLIKKKVDDIFKKLDRKEMKFYFKRWKMKKDAKKKKKFFIYFIMLMKEYFCNDKSLKYNKEYALGKSLFFWYRKTFNYLNPICHIRQCHELI